MAKQALLDTVSKATSRQTTINDHLKRKMAFTAKSLAEKDRAMRQSKREQAERMKAQKEARTKLALCGVNALCRLGVSPEFKKLIKARHGKPVVIYGVVRSEGGGWKITGLVQMTDTQLEIQSHIEVSGKLHDDFPSVSIELSYATSSRRTRMEALELIATTQAFEWEQVRLEDEKSYQLLSPDALFEVLVECANTKNCERRIEEAIASP